MAGTPIILCGGGRMGGAILTGLKATGEREIYVVDPNVAEAPGATLLRHADDLPDLDEAVVVIAVKPQIVAGVLPQLMRLTKPGVLFVSIVAGATFAALRAGLGEDARLVRAMPNTPAAVLKGVSGAVAGPGVSPEQRALCDGLLSAIGDVVWLTDESQIDMVTAVSGSGPAYFFRFAEAMAAAGTALGLPAEIAERLARRTLEGAGALAASTDRSLAQLRIEVTSPKGTTAAALEQFDADGRLQTLVKAAAKAAQQRSLELGREISG
jgi:pyrroline-5-carboxylate reductase